MTCQLYCSFTDTLPQHNKKNSTLQEFLPTRADLCNIIIYIFLNKQSGSCRTLNVFLLTCADICNFLFFFFYKQSSSRRTLRAFLYFICFTFNVIHQGPLNNKHRSLYALSYTLSASRLMSSIKAHLTINTDHCMRFPILYLLHV